MPVTAVLFDAYGTLFDVHAVVSLAESYFPGRGAALSQAWRTRQLEYTWLRTLSDQYADFEQVTGDALQWAAESLGLPLGTPQHAALLAVYRTLAPFPENADTLHILHGRGLVLGTLSNGTPAMLDAALRSSGIDKLLTHVISVDAIGRYKTDRAAYALGTQALKRPANVIAFVSSNGWDAIGATWFGYRTFWVNRTGAPLDRLGATPEGTGRTLADLPRFLDTLD